MENESSTSRVQTNRDEGEFKEGHYGNDRTVHPFTASQDLEPLDSRGANFGAIGWLPCQPGYSLGTLVTSLSSDAKASSIQCASREGVRMEDGEGRDRATVAALSTRRKGQTQSTLMRREDLCECQLCGLEA